ncbi:MAG TPA: hypothetical protein VN851_15320 [Thermoanaerobaculia bacterium]|nr:hypothetical protein [Thermoanaerobaculia bacterium]
MAEILRERLRRAIEWGSGVVAMTAAAADLTVALPVAMPKWLHWLAPVRDLFASIPDGIYHASYIVFVTIFLTIYLKERAEKRRPPLLLLERPKRSVLPPPYMPLFQLLADSQPATAVTLKEISDQITAVPLIARKEVSKQFMGMWVLWTVGNLSIEDKGTFCILRGMEDWPSLCTLAAEVERTPDLSLLGHSSKVTIYGRVATVDRGSVILTPAKITAIDNSARKSNPA